MSSIHDRRPEAVHALSTQGDAPQLCFVRAARCPPELRAHPIERPPCAWVDFISLKIYFKKKINASKFAKIEVFENS